MQAFASGGPEAAEQVLAEIEAARPKLQDAIVKSPPRTN
jgi:hypothetical protein